MSGQVVISDFSQTESTYAFKSINPKLAHPLGGSSIQLVGDFENPPTRTRACSTLVSTSSRPCHMSGIWMRAFNQQDTMRWALSHRLHIKYSLSFVRLRITYMCKYVHIYISVVMWRSKWFATHKYVYVIVYTIVTTALTNAPTALVSDHSPIDDQSKLLRDEIYRHKVYKSILISLFPHFRNNQNVHKQSDR